MFVFIVYFLFIHCSSRCFRVCETALSPQSHTPSDHLRQSGRSDRTTGSAFSPPAPGHGKAPRSDVDGGSTKWREPCPSSAEARRFLGALPGESCTRAALPAAILSPLLHPGFRRTTLPTSYSTSLFPNDQYAALAHTSASAGVSNRSFDLLFDLKHPSMPPMSFFFIIIIDYLSCVLLVVHGKHGVARVTVNKWWGKGTKYNLRQSSLCPAM